MSLHKSVIIKTRQLSDCDINNYGARRDIRTSDNAISSKSQTRGFFFWQVKRMNFIVFILWIFSSYLSESDVTDCTVGTCTRGYLRPLKSRPQSTWAKRVVFDKNRHRKLRSDAHVFYRFTKRNDYRTQCRIKIKIRYGFGLYRVRDKPRNDCVVWNNRKTNEIIIAFKKPIIDRI